MNGDFYDNTLRGINKFHFAKLTTPNVNDYYLSCDMHKNESIVRVRNWNSLRHDYGRILKRYISNDIINKRYNLFDKGVREKKTLPEICPAEKQIREIPKSQVLTSVMYKTKNLMHLNYKSQTKIISINYKTTYQVVV